MGTGYTRNDAANNIADGNVINASDLDGEFDAVQAAFNGTTGHSHDGTTGEGPQIAAGGIAADAIDGTKIADDSIDSEHYVDGSIDTAHIGNLQVTTAKIAADAIDGTKIADDAVDSEHYTDGSIDRVHLAADIVDGTKIADDSINSEHYVDGSIDTAHIANDAVTGDKLANNIQIAGTLGVTGETTLTTHLNMGDNDIIKLGDSADLQIYHDGSNSYIDDVGTGSLLIRAESLTLEDTSGNNYLTAAHDGEVRLYYINSQKLAINNTGIDVTGVITTDGMTTSADINFGDNDKAVFGAGSDLQIYHDGSNSYIHDNGTGLLKIRATDFRLSNADNTADYIACTDGGDVDLSFNGSVKLSTKTDGVDITGELQCDSLDVDGNADISGELTMGGNINLQDNDTLRIGTGADLRLYHDGSNSYIDDLGTGDLYIRASDDLVLQKYTGETMINCNVDGAVDLYHNNVKKLETTSSGISVTGSVLSSDGSLGLDGTDYIQFVNNSYLRLIVNGGERARVEADGDFHADGDVIAYSTTISDERLKTDIEKIENATDKVSQLNGYTFTYKADGKKSAGVIAQEVEKVLPSAVSEKELPLKTDDGVAYKTVQYDQIIGLLIESIKELKQEINELKGR
jgi:hypothetical protein